MSHIANVKKITFVKQNKAKISAVPGLEKRLMHSEGVEGQRSSEMGVKLRHS